MELIPSLDTLRPRTAADRLAGSGGTPSLFRRNRPFEGAIQTVLFATAIISVFTTLAILVVLGSEALRFFTRYGWVNTNHQLAAPLDAYDTEISISASGRTLAMDNILRIGEEEMRVVEVVDAETLRVERAVEGTLAGTHEPGGTVFLGERATLGEFLTGTTWQPQVAEFGVWPLLTSTLITSLIAMCVAGPIGLGAAVFLSEYASPRLRSTVKPILEILAGVPTVVYGYFALTFMTPLLRSIFGTSTVGVYNMASAGIVMGIMIVPTISSMSEDALSAVPRSLREGSYGLGATRLETVRNVLIPAALSGIMAAFILGIARAVGETMIVAVAAGAGPNFTLNPFEAAETMTGHIARISTGDVSFGSIDYNSLFAIGLTLFVITLGLNLISNAVRARFREVYQ